MHTDLGRIGIWTFALYQLPAARAQDLATQLEALGAHPYYAPPEHTAFARETMGTRGDEGAIRARVQAHHDAGADHVAIQVLPYGVPGVLLRTWTTLAAALL